MTIFNGKIHYAWPFSSSLFWHHRRLNPIQLTIFVGEKSHVENLMKPPFSHEKTTISDPGGAETLRWSACAFHEAAIGASSAGPGGDWSHENAGAFKSKGGILYIYIYMIIFDYIYIYIYICIIYVYYICQVFAEPFQHSPMVSCNMHDPAGAKGLNRCFTEAGRARDLAGKRFLGWVRMWFM